MPTRCYHCNRFKDTKTYKTEPKKKWKKTDIRSKGGFLWLCPTCNENKCEKCHILLSNTYRCKTCGKIHGSFYKKQPNLCKKCFNKYNKKEE